MVDSTILHTTQVENDEFEPFVDLSNAISDEIQNIFNLNEQKLKNAILTEQNFYNIIMQQNLPIKIIGSEFFVILSDKSQILFNHNISNDLSPPTPFLHCTISLGDMCLEGFLEPNLNFSYFEKREYLVLLNSCIGNFEKEGVRVDVGIKMDSGGNNNNICVATLNELICGKKFSSFYPHLNLALSVEIIDFIGNKYYNSDGAKMKIIEFDKEKLEDGISSKFYVKYPHVNSKSEDVFKVIRKRDSFSIYKNGVEYNYKNKTQGNHDDHKK